MHTDMLERTPTAVVVAPDGEPEPIWASELERQLMPLAERGASRVLVDLRGAPRIDSIALGLLVLAQRKLSLGGGELVLKVSNHEVLRTLEVTGLDRFFTIEAD